MGYSPECVYDPDKPLPLLFQMCIRDRVIAVFDSSDDFDETDKQILDYTSDKTRIIIINKTDLTHGSCIDQIKELSLNSPIIEASILTGSGMDKLSGTIHSIYHIGEISASSGTVITNLRHKKALEKAEVSLGHAVEAIETGMPSDIASIDINAAIESLGEITGETVSDLIIDSIFHNFCVGK